jgi:thioredoxin reductase
MECAPTGIKRSCSLPQVGIAPGKDRHKAASDGEMQAFTQRGVFVCMYCSALVSGKMLVMIPALLRRYQGT